MAPGLLAFRRPHSFEGEMFAKFVNSKVAVRVADETLPDQLL